MLSVKVPFVSIRINVVQLLMGKVSLIFFWIAIFVVSKTLFHLCNFDDAVFEDNFCALVTWDGLGYSTFSQLLR